MYCAIGVTLQGERDILGLWVGAGGEGSKFWQQVLTEIKNLGTKDVCIVVSDGLTGMTEAIAATWTYAIHQTCVIHLLRNTLRYASRRDWPAIAADLRPVYLAATEAAARARFEANAREVGQGVPRDREVVGVIMGGVRAVPEVRS